MNTDQLHLNFEIRLKDFSASGRTTPNLLALRPSLRMATSRHFLQFEYK